MSRVHTDRPSDKGHFRDRVATRDRYCVGADDRVSGGGRHRRRRYILLTWIGFMKPQEISGNDSTSATTFSPTANDPSSLPPGPLPSLRGLCFFFFAAAELPRRARGDPPRSSGDETRYTLRQIYRNTDKEIPPREGATGRVPKLGRERPRKTRAGESFSPPVCIGESFP